MTDMTRNENKTQLTSAAKAAAFVKRHNGELVSDVFGDFFAYHTLGTDEYHVAKVREPHSTRVRVYPKAFANADEAIKEARVRAKHEPVVVEATLPIQTVVDQFCRETGFKASDSAFGDFVIVSKPLRDREREWHIAKRKGNALELLPDRLRDRWAANAKARQEGLGSPVEPLFGPHMFPYGNQFPRASQPVHRPEPVADKPREMADSTAE